MPHYVLLTEPSPEFRALVPPKGFAAAHELTSAKLENWKKPTWQLAPGDGALPDFLHGAAAPVVSRRVQEVLGDAGRYFPIKGKELEGYALLQAAATCNVVDCKQSGVTWKGSARTEAIAAKSLIPIDENLETMIDRLITPDRFPPSLLLVSDELIAKLEDAGITGLVFEPMEAYAWSLGIEAPPRDERAEETAREEGRSAATLPSGDVDPDTFPDRADDAWWAFAQPGYEDAPPEIGRAWRAGYVEGLVALAAK